MRSLALASLLLVPAAAGCRSDLPPGGIAEPVDDWANQFSVVRRDGDVYFAGAPTQRGLETAVDSGVETVVSLMSETEEQKALGFDEESEVARLGARFVRIPFTAESFAVEHVDDFAQALADTDGKLLLHCASSNRTGGLWAAYLIRHRALPLDEALGAGIHAGLSSQTMMDAVRRVASMP